MNGIPSNLNKLNDKYKCPICLLISTTKIQLCSKTNIKPGEFFCFNYSFWTIPLIQGFTSLLSAICMKPQYSVLYFLPEINIPHWQPSPVSSRPYKDRDFWSYISKLIRVENEEVTQTSWTFSPIMNAFLWVLGSQEVLIMVWLRDQTYYCKYCLCKIAQCWSLW